MGKDSDAVIGIILGILGLAALIKASEKDYTVQNHGKDIKNSKNLPRLFPK